jgi:hypothetical protein
MENTHGKPDPTILTTAALKLSIDNLKELLFVKLEDEAKFTAAEISELHKRLSLMEKQRLELKEDSSKALSAALVSQERLFDQKNICTEEAAAKAEAGFTKQIEALSKEAGLAREGLSDRITAIKERMDRGGGREEQQGVTRGQSNWMIGLIVVAVIQIINILIVLLK